MSKSLYIRGEKFKKIMEFDVLHLAWECDSKGWIVENYSSGRYIVLTNHGSPYIAPQEELIKLIESYQSVINKTKEALALYQ